MHSAHYKTNIPIVTGEDPIQSGFYYFLAASLVIIVALVMYPIFLNLPISKFYLDRVTDEVNALDILSLLDY